MSAAEERRKAMTAAVVQKCGATYQSAKDISATMKVAQEDTGHILRESMEQVGAIYSMSSRYCFLIPVCTAP